MTNYVGGGNFQRVERESAGDYALHGLGAAESSILTRFAQVEQHLSQALRPVYPQLDAIPAPPYVDQGWHARLKSQPLTAMIQVFQPVENLIIEIITRTNQITQKPSRSIGIPGVNAVTTDMSIYQPGDEQMDVTTRDLVRRVREVGFFMILAQQSSPSLIVAITQVLTKYGLQGGAAVAAFLRQHGVVLPPLPGVQPSLPSLPDPSSFVMPALPSTPSWTPPPNLPKLFGLGIVPAVLAAEIGVKATTAIDTAWDVGMAAAAIIVPPVLIGILLGATQGVTTAAGAQQVPPAGTPGPRGETDGQWVPGPPGKGPVYQPGSVSSLKTSLGPYAVPVAIGLGALLLLRR